jgi:hypothetical protein
MLKLTVPAPLLNPTRKAIWLPGPEKVWVAGLSTALELRELTSETDPCRAAPVQTTRADISEGEFGSDVETKAASAVFV